jgi:polyferredoxin
VHNFSFRITHLVAIGVVVLQSWLGLICPLTVWEMDLRARADDSVYEGSFIAYWMQSLLYYRAEEWVFILLYTLFAVLVVASWYWVRPRR